MILTIFEHGMPFGRLIYIMMTCGFIFDITITAWLFTDLTSAIPTFTSVFVILVLSGDFLFYIKDH